jgi:hypothetical protein
VLGHFAAHYARGEATVNSTTGCESGSLCEPRGV